LFENEIFPFCYSDQREEPVDAGMKEESGLSNRAWSVRNSYFFSTSLSGFLL